MSTSVVSLVGTKRGMEGSYYYEGDYNEILTFLHSIESRVTDDLKFRIVSERDIYSEYKPYIKCMSLCAFDMLSR